MVGLGASRAGCASINSLPPNKPWPEHCLVPTGVCRGLIGRGNLIGCSSRTMLSLRLQIFCLYLTAVWMGPGSASASRTVEPHKKNAVITSGCSAHSAAGHAQDPPVEEEEEEDWLASCKERLQALREPVPKEQHHHPTPLTEKQQQLLDQTLPSEIWQQVTYPDLGDQLGNPSQQVSYPVLKPLSPGLLGPCIRIVLKSPESGSGNNDVVMEDDGDAAGEMKEDGGIDQEPQDRVLIGHANSKPPSTTCTEKPKPLLVSSASGKRGPMVVKKPTEAAPDQLGRPSTKEQLAELKAKRRKLMAKLGGLSEFQNGRGKKIRKRLSKINAKMQEIKRDD